MPIVEKFERIVSAASAYIVSPPKARIHEQAREERVDGVFFPSDHRNEARPERPTEAKATEAAYNESERVRF